jgi:capsule polysaccharide export protein KpsE/RkpR
VKLEAEIEGLERLMAEVREGSSDFTTGPVSQKELPELQQRYAALQREVTLHQQILAALKQQLELTRLEEFNTAGMFQIVEYAEVPEVKAKPRRGLIAVASAFAGFMLSVLVAFVADSIARAGKDPEEAERIAAIRHALQPRRRRRKGEPTG